jgi:CheY-like chemotaxis protein
MSDFLKHRKENGHSVVPKDLRILIVDDDDLNQRLLSMILSKDKYKLTVSYDGYDALKSLEKDAYDLVFMDIRIPRVNGFEVCEHIRGGNFVNQKTPIVALTALPSRNEKLQDFLDRGMFTRCIHKPFDVSQIEEILNAIKENKQERVSFTSVPTKQEVTEKPVINIEKVMPIFGDDMDVYEGLFNEFLRSLPERVANIQQSEKKRDWKQLSRLGHNLTGITRNFGAEKLSDLAEQLDNEAGKGHASVVQHLVNEIAECVPELKDAYAVLIAKNH